MLAWQQPTPDFVTLEVVGVETRTHYSTTLPADVAAALSPQQAGYSFDAPPEPFRLALEARRLRLAHTADPLLAANNARVHLLPHQMEAVYGVLLPQPTIRHLMAHDAGAGKTVIGGLLHKELASRTPGLRTLVVAPAALTVQWQRELRDKFLTEFTIVDRSALDRDPQIWHKLTCAITSLPFARQADVQLTLATVRWDLVLVDEAHHMAGYEKGETLAYQLGRRLAQNTKHLVLATATPHKGDPINFLRLLQLLDPDIHDPNIVNQRAPGQRGNPLMLRRLKEEMVDFDGNKLFKPRTVVTRWHVIGENPPEMALYTALTDYVDKTYRAAERIGGRVKVNTEYAMVILQRRMASSFAALEKSLLRRRAALLLTQGAAADDFDLSEIEELAERERWRQEEAAETATPAQNTQEREKEAGEIQSLLDKLDAIRASGRETKVEELRKLIDEMGITPANGEKLLVFTEFKDTLDFLRTLFEGWGYTVTQIDGSMAHERRRDAEAAFAGHCQVMLATEAAGEGINLQFCAYMVNYDLPWIPTRLEQRMGRIHRYGQERVAHIYNLVAFDTREGSVLLGLLERLDQMRTHLGDQVFDVVSALVSDMTVERLMARVALAKATDPVQDEVLHSLIQVMNESAQRLKQWEDHPFALSTAQFRQMQQASRQSRLTPEYAQHFFVDVLTALNETPVALPDPEKPAGDAAVFAVTLERAAVARELRLPPRERRLFTFRAGDTEAAKAAGFLALGAPLFERMLTLAETRWGANLQAGAQFIDVDLAPGEAYLLWFVAAQVRDGADQVVAETLFAVKQTADGYAAAPASSLIDLLPAPQAGEAPAALQAWAATPATVLTWSIGQQQLPLLERVRGARQAITDLRCGPLLADATAAAEAAQTALADLVFSTPDAATEELEARVDRANARVAALAAQFAHEAACSLGPAHVVAVAAVTALLGAPETDMEDERPAIGKRAEALALEYELKQGRAARNVSGRYDEYPYDIHSTGPGGARCIEVKGTTNGAIKLSETQRRAARKLGRSYYLYVIDDPLGAQPRLTIIRDPLSKMEYDQTLHSGVRYVFHAQTWRSAADEAILL